MTARELVLAGRRYSVDGEGYEHRGRGSCGSPERATSRVRADSSCRWRSCSDATVADDGQIVGDPTEAALVVLAAKGGIDVDAIRGGVPAVTECR